MHSWCREQSVEIASDLIGFLFDLGAIYISHAYQYITWTCILESARCLCSYLGDPWLLENNH